MRKVGRYLNINKLY